MYPMYPKSSSEKFYLNFCWNTTSHSILCRVLGIFSIIYSYITSHYTTLLLITWHDITSHQNTLWHCDIVTILQTVTQLSRFCWPWALTEISEDHWRPKLPNRTHSGCSTSLHLHLSSVRRDSAPHHDITTTTTTTTTTITNSKYFYKSTFLFSLGENFSGKRD